MTRITRPLTQLLLLLVFGSSLAACSVNEPAAPSATGDDPAAQEAEPVSANEPTASDPSGADASADPDAATTPASPTPVPATEEIATLGAGCFWCIEAVLEQIDGVTDVDSGYMGGAIENPTYKQICTGTTGHAEVVRVTFDPARISYAELLDWFWRLHDPTTLNRQGADVGTQYRSAIFYHSPEQKQVAEQSKRDAQASGAFADPIVTEITAASTYYPAEGYHQDYYRLNPEQGYCRVVIRPKLKKLGLEE